MALRIDIDLEKMASFARRHEVAELGRLRLRTQRQTSARRAM